MGGTYHPGANIGVGKGKRLGEILMAMLDVCYVIEYDVAGNEDHKSMPINSEKPSVSRKPPRPKLQGAPERLSSCLLPKQFPRLNDRFADIKGTPVPESAHALC